jgi:hypothetical protein
MIKVEYRFERLKLNVPHVTRQVEKLADDITDLLVVNNRIALITANKKVTDKTFNSVKARSVRRTRFVQHRQVVAGQGFKFIRDGRKAGSKMPVRMARMSVRSGKPIFAPQPRLAAWFKALGIEKSEWFPIMRAIARRGIRPIRIDHHAITRAVPQIRSMCQTAAINIGRGILVKV